MKSFFPSSVQCENIFSRLFSSFLCLANIKHFFLFLAEFCVIWKERKMRGKNLCWRDKMIFIKQKKERDFFSLTWQLGVKICKREITFLDLCESISNYFFWHFQVHEKYEIFYSFKSLQNIQIFMLENKLTQVTKQMQKPLT